MNILVVADIHYSLKQFDWLLERAAGYEAVIIAGDLLDLQGHATMDAQIVVASKYLKRLTSLTTVIASSGNHDGDVQTQSGEYVAEWLKDVGGGRLFVDGQSVVFGDTLVTVCPWWEGARGRADVERFLEAEELRRVRRWIWVNHAPPNGSRVSWTGKKFFGEAEVNGLVQRFRPDAIISGHVHNSPFFPAGSWFDLVGNTWVFNPGRQLGGVPAYIELDLTAWRAGWVSDMDVQRFDLDDLEAVGRSLS